MTPCIVLFTQIQNGHNDLRLAEAAPTSADTTGMSEGLVFHPLEADLFSSAATSHIDEVGLSNTTLQAVLQLLLLSKETAKKDRGFISYAELGINQLGRVYEGLMSYTGFFAEADLFEVAPKGDASKGSWVIETDRAEHIGAEDFVREFDERNGDMVPVIHRRGSFVFRLSGRDRQQSASYYTPEVLTQFTVSQALAELLTEDTTADEILALTVCEPALGSGAFALEAVKQLSAEYLRRKQNEVEQRIDPADYPQEFQKTKAYIALHNVYGVDLNATAVELAEISLWLDTMVTGLSAPWFGLRLRRGNSLIGARRSVYSPHHGQGQDLAEIHTGQDHSGGPGPTEHLPVPPTRRRLGCRRRCQGRQSAGPRGSGSAEELAQRRCASSSATRRRIRR